MDISDWVLAILGAMFGLAAILTAASAVGSVVTRFLERLSRYRSLIALRDLGFKMVSDSWWLTEDPAAMILLYRIGREVSRTGTYRVDELRRRWREDMRNFDGDIWKTIGDDAQLHHVCPIRAPEGEGAK